MIGRHGHLHFEVSKAKSKLARPGKLMVLPSLVVAISAETGIPLRHRVIVIIVFREIFITASCTAESYEITTVRNPVIPIDVEYKFLPWLYRRRKIDFHHRFVYRIMKRLPG